MQNKCRGTGGWTGAWTGAWTGVGTGVGKETWAYSIWRVEAYNKALLGEQEQYIGSMWRSSDPPYKEGKPAEQECPHHQTKGHESLHQRWWLRWVEQGLCHRAKLSYTTDCQLIWVLKINKMWVNLKFQKMYICWTLKLHIFPVSPVETNERNHYLVLGRQLTNVPTISPRPLFLFTPSNTDIFLEWHLGASDPGAGLANALGIC